MNVIFNWVKDFIDLQITIEMDLAHAHTEIHFKNQETSIRAGLFNSCDDHKTFGSVCECFKEPVKYSNLKTPKY